MQEKKNLRMKNFYINLSSCHEVPYCHVKADTNYRTDSEIENGKKHVFDKSHTLTGIEGNCMIIAKKKYLFIIKRVKTSIYKVSVKYNTNRK